MIHATNCTILAIDEEDLDVQRIENLDTKLALRGQRVEATFADILPSEDDDEHLMKVFTCIIAEMLVRYTPESKSWKEHADILDKVKKMMPSDRPLKVKKTDARPFGVFDINEGSKKGIVKVMEAICERSTLPEDRWSAKTRMVLGDWLTSNNLRGARRNRADDINSMERVEYVEELSSLWHYALQSTHCHLYKPLSYMTCPKFANIEHHSTRPTTYPASCPRAIYNACLYTEEGKGILLLFIRGGERCSGCRGCRIGGRGVQGVNLGRAGICK
jgi:hypothetical protein